MNTNIILNISITDPPGCCRELNISENDEVWYSDKDRQFDQLCRSRRDVNDFLWQVEGLTENWQKRYGSGQVTDPKSWMVMLEKNQQLTTYRGNGEYPPNWKEFIEALGNFLKQGNRP